MLNPFLPINRRKEWKKRGHKLSLGIGVSTSEATLGKIGYEKRIDYAAIGSVTNLAARLCSEAPPEHILISPSTLKEMGTQFRTSKFGDIKVKGFSETIPVYNLPDQ